ncbi:tetratricopeptide repeat protein [Flavobacterium sp. GCM10027622]|uniref:type IX secretion system periplasmic lipoprotein PorW/SprE n=1 Tax=unclassified Flavobacterium TaxID=196869 RepID=UPI0036206411
MLKIKHLKYFPPFLLLLFIVACSTKKNSFVNRNWHAINTEYNTLYNGDIALQSGINELKSGYSDNFWEILPVERMQIEEDAMLPGEKGKNKNFERAEEKATKAIQKHSMNIGGKEKNMQMDEAHLLLGKSRYYDKRYVPALEAFNYILYKYSNSDKIYEAKVWREKTNIRLENDALAIKNLKLLLKRDQLKTQVKADANAILAQAFINLEQKDSAIAPLKIAIESTKLKEERARYHFILGQVYQSLQYNDSAYAQFQEIIEMKRKSPRHYVIRAHAKQGQLVDATKDTVAFLEKYEKLLKDRENRPYLDVLNYEVGLFYDHLNKKQQAVKFYNKSLRSTSTDSYLQAQTYKNLATIYFDRTEYVTAGKYYDSTLIRLVKKNKEYFAIAKKRENLNDVIKYEGIVKHNDSILNIVSLSQADRLSFFEKHIADLKAKDDAKKEFEKKQREAEENARGVQDIKPNLDISTGRKTLSQDPSLSPPGFNTGQDKGLFYFYTPTTVAYGKVEFQKRWGKRALKDNWRWSVLTENETTDGEVKTNEVKKDEPVSELYTTEYYLKKLPTSQVVLDSLARDRNFANYQLGVIYKEKFLEQELASSKFEKVLASNPEERLILPSKYNLYQIYQSKNPAKADEIKNSIIADYPNTRYAQILSGQIVDEPALNQTPSEVYNTNFKLFGNQEYVQVLQNIDKSLEQFAGDDLIPKFELLKASAVGKLRGVEEYKKAVNYVAMTYPDSKEGKQAEDILKVSIPRLEQMAISLDTVSTNWKILYKVGKKDDAATVDLMDKINRYIKEKDYTKFRVSYDVYNETENFVVVHGISSKEFSRYLIELLQTNKEYKIKIPANVISSENYAVIQVRKNYNQFLELKI